MTTAITATTSGTANTIDSGADYGVVILNSGTVPVHLTPGDVHLAVGQSVTWETQGSAVKGYVDSAAGQVTVTVLAAPYKRTGKTVGSNAGIPAATVAAGAQAATAAADTAGIADAAGSVAIAALASGNAAGAVCTVTFGETWGATPKSVQLQPRSAAAVSAGLWVSAKSATAFTVSAASAPGASASLAFDYAVTG